MVAFAARRVKRRKYLGVSTRAIALWILFYALVARGADAPKNLASATEAPVRARVVIVQDPGATVEFAPRLEIVRPMVDRGLTNLLRTTTPIAAWQRLISTQDVVGIKVFSVPGRTSGTRPAVVEAVVQSLLAAGLPAQQIIIWDKERGYLKNAGFFEFQERYGVRVESSLAAGYDTNHFYDMPLLGQLVWGDLEFGLKGDAIGRRSYLSKLLTKEVTKIINITPLLNHNLAAVSGNLYSLAMASVDNTLRFTSDADRLARAVPEIYALPLVGDRVVLNIVDALVGQYEGEEKSFLHYSSVLNQLRFSTDPVALDVLSIQELDHQRELAKVPKVKNNLDLYQNASLVEIGVADPRHIQIEWVQ